jgi:hypothetical protein
MVLLQLRAEMDPSLLRFGGGWFDIILDADTPYILLQATTCLQNFPLS